MFVFILFRLSSCPIFSGNLRVRHATAYLVDNSILFFCLFCWEPNGLCNFPNVDEFTAYRHVRSGWAAHASLHNLQCSLQCSLFLLAQSERFSFLPTSSPSLRPLPLSLRASHRHRWRLCPRRAAAAAAAADPNGGAKAAVKSFFKGLRRNDRKRSVLVSIFSHILNRVCGSGSGQAVHSQGGGHELAGMFPPQGLATFPFLLWVGLGRTRLAAFPRFLK